jgi:hypothetical protein
MVLPAPSYSVGDLHPSLSLPIILTANSHRALA